MAEAYDSDRTQTLLMKVFDEGGRAYLLTLQDRKAVSALNMMQKVLIQSAVLTLTNSHSH